MHKLFTIKIVSSFIVLLFAASLNLGIVNAQSGRIEIPTIEVNAEFIPLFVKDLPEGTTWDTSILYQNIGYLTGTGWFGRNQNVVLGGHSEGAGRQPDVFFNLGQIAVNDIIYVHADDTVYSYVVTSMEWVSPNDVSSVYPTDYEQLTLITCDTNSYNGGIYEKRLIVRARPA